MRRRWFAPRLLRCVSSTAGLLLAGWCTARADIPAGFVYLRDIDPTIVQEIRYAGSHNFVGRPVAGYEAPECILTAATARALARVQQRLRTAGYSLKVYDCYRPTRAVRDFAVWAEDSVDTRAQAEFYPGVDKARLFALGYIARRSSHSKGNTVDVTIVPAGSGPAIHQDGEARAACHLPVGQRFADNSLDFGTGYDCFHVLSHTASAGIGAEVRRNRGWLVGHMSAVGFRNYAKEWWHFELAGSGARAGLDFPVTAHPATAAPEVPRSDPVLLSPPVPVRERSGAVRR